MAYSDSSGQVTALPRIYDGSLDDGADQSQVGASAEMGPWPAAKPTRSDRADSLAMFIKQETAKKKIRDAEREATYAKVDRQTDEVTTPLIVNDAKERIAHKESLAAQMNDILMGQTQNREQQQGIMGQLGSMQSPELPKTQIGIQDIIAAGIASLVGGAQGFNQAVGGAYERQGQMDVQRFKEQSANQEMQREQLMLQLRQLGVDENTAQRMFEVLQSREWNLDAEQRGEGYKIADDERARDLEVFRQGELTKRAAIRDPAKLEYYRMLGKTPEGRELLARAVQGNDPDAIAAAREMTEAEKLSASRRTGVDLDNDRKTEELKWLPKLMAAKVFKSEQDGALVAKKIETWPQYLQATMARVEIARQLANNTIGNTQFDNSMSVWKAQSMSKVSGWQKEIAGNLKRAEKVNQGSPLDAAAQLARIATRNSELEAKINAELEAVPTLSGAITSGGVKGAPQGAGIVRSQDAPMNPNERKGIPNAPSDANGKILKPKATTKPKQGATTFKGSVDGANVTVRVRKKP